MAVRGRRSLAQVKKTSRMPDVEKNTHIRVADGTREKKDKVSRKLQEKQKAAQER